MPGSRQARPNAFRPEKMRSHGQLYPLRPAGWAPHTTKSSSQAEALASGSTNLPSHSKRARVLQSMPSSQARPGQTHPSRPVWALLPLTDSALPGAGQSQPSTQGQGHLQPALANEVAAAEDSVRMPVMTHSASLGAGQSHSIQGQGRHQPAPANEVAVTMPGVRKVRAKATKQKQQAPSHPKPACFQSVSTWGQASLSYKLHLLALVEPEQWNPASAQRRLVSEVTASLAIGFNLWPNSSFPCRQPVQPHQLQLLQDYKSRGQPLNKRPLADIVAEFHKLKASQGLPPSQPLENSGQSKQNA
jgi:hypothetical protein